VVKILVLGVGNILMTDDGVGVHAALELAKESWPENVTVMEGGTFTQDVYYLFMDYDQLLVLDCVRAKHPPGTIYRLTEDDIKQNREQRMSVHDIDLIDSLRMAEMAGKRPEMVVIGIEPESMGWSMEMTGTLREKFPKFLEHARKELRAMIERAGGEKE
jgi:hydrogenase maturation protease